MIALIPLLIVPFILYNLTIFGLMGGNGVLDLQSRIMQFQMASGAMFSLTLGSFFILIALLLLFVEIFKATRTSRNSVLDHMVSLFLFIAFLVEFLLVQGAATQEFFLLMIIVFIDVIAGFTISIRSAGRDVSIGL